MHWMLLIKERRSTQSQIVNTPHFFRIQNSSSIQNKNPAISFSVQVSMCDGLILIPICHNYNTIGINQRISN